MVASESSSKLTRDAFLAAVHSSGLLTQSQLERAEHDIPPQARNGADVAKCLVAAGLLTKYQTDRLLAGKKDGYHLGQYLILEEVGRSSTGRVFRARHRTMNRLVAVKVLSNDLTRTSKQRQAFQAEARSAARLTHPNVVTILDTNQVNERLFLVLEYLEGASVDTLVRAGGSMPLHRACEIIRQAALGLQHAHEKGLPHGVLSPQCLLIGRPGGTTSRSDKPMVKVSNFGVGRTLDSEGSKSLSYDPLDYRAPELFKTGGTPTPSSDLYSLGCLLFYLLAGRVPFGGVSGTDKIHRHLNHSPPALETVRGDVPPAITGLVRALMDKSPSRRPRSAAEVATYLEPYCSVDAARIDFDMTLFANGSGAYPNGYSSGMVPCGPLSGPMPIPPEYDSSPFAELDHPTPEEFTPRRQPAKFKRLGTILALSVSVTLLMMTVLGAWFVYSKLKGH